MTATVQPADDQLMTIGEVAAAAGMAVSAVRYYDDIGLITTTTRVGGKRRFGPDTVGRVNFVQGAKEAGFSLDEIRRILDDNAGGWRALVGSKQVELRERRDRLDAMISMLTEIESCGCRVVAGCNRYVGG